MPVRKKTTNPSIKLANPMQQIIKYRASIRRAARTINKMVAYPALLSSHVVYNGEEEAHGD